MTLTDRQFTGLLKRAARIARQASDVSGELSKAFEERYGCTHSDVDCDYLIDAVDYGQGGELSAKIADREMAQCGIQKKVK